MEGPRDGPSQVVRPVTDRTASVRLWGGRDEPEVMAAVD